MEGEGDMGAGHARDCEWPTLSVAAAAVVVVVVVLMPAVASAQVPRVVPLDIRGPRREGSEEGTSRLSPRGSWPWRAGAEGGRSRCVCERVVPGPAAGG